MEVFEIFSQVPFLPEILQGLVAAHALALFIVNLTPTPTDNLWLARIYKYVEFAAGIIKPKNVKQPNPFDPKQIG
jgi:hypothetical protein